MTIWQGNLAKPNVVHRTPFFRFWLQKFRIAIQTRECAKNCFWARAVCALSRPSLSAALGRMRSAKSRPCHSVRPRPSHRSQPNADGGAAQRGKTRKTAPCDFRENWGESERELSCQDILMAFVILLAPRVLLFSWFHLMKAWLCIRWGPNDHFRLWKLLFHNQTFKNVGAIVKLRSNMGE